MQDKPSQLNVPAAASLTSCLTGGRSMWNCQTYDGLSVCQHWFPLRLNMVICCKYNNLELSAVKTVEVIVDYYQRLQTSSLYIAAQLTVKSFHFLGTAICQNLKQELKISFLIKNAQQKMHYKRQGLRKAAACYQFCQKGDWLQSAFSIELYTTRTLRWVKVYVCLSLFLLMTPINAKNLKGKLLQYGLLSNSELWYRNCIDFSS